MKVIVQLRTVIIATGATRATGATGATVHSVHGPARPFVELYEAHMLER